MSCNNHIDADSSCPGKTPLGTSGCFNGEVRLYDSLFNGKLTSSLEQQLARLYGNLAEEDQLMVTAVSVQQQQGGSDCGAFAIANAFHAARGDDVHCLSIRVRHKCHG